MTREHARFVVTFTPAPGVNGVRSLRLMLKSAKRRFGLRCARRNTHESFYRASPRQRGKASGAHSAAS